MSTRRLIMAWLEAFHKRKRVIEITLLLLILALALFLRLRRLDTTEILGDQSFTLNTAMRWVKGGAIPLAANKSSAGFINPPMIEYLYALALRVWADILSVAVLTMVAGMVAIALAGWSSYRVFGKRAAFWTVLVFAFNPWSVFYSQLIWNQTMVPVFSTLTLACLLLFFAVEQRSGYLILSFVSAACMTQVHPGSSVQLLTMGIIFIIFRRKLRLWPLLLGIAVFFILYVPFLLYERGVGWIDVKAALELARQSAPFSFAAALVSSDLVRAQGLFRSARYVIQVDRLMAVWLSLSLAYAVWTSARVFARWRQNPGAVRKATGLIILLLWFALPVLFFLRSSTYLQVYYLIGQWPAHFLLMGALWDGIQRSLEQIAMRTRRSAAQRIMRTVAWGIIPLSLMALAGWQFWFSLRFQDARFESRSKNVWQIRHVRTAVKMIRDLLDERRECTLVVVSEGHNLETSQLSLLREFTFPERILLTDGRYAVPVATPCSVYLDALPGKRTSTWLETVATPIPDARIQVLGRTWQFYDVSASAEVNPVEKAVSEPRLARWENGVSLLQYTRGQAQPGATMPLTLDWFIEASPPEVVYHIGTYLITMEDEVAAQSDGPGFDSIQWRAGDRFITWFDIPLPQDLSAGTYQLAITLYSWPALERVNLMSGENIAFLETFRVEAP